MDIVFGDATLGVRCGGCEYLFSYQSGGLESLRKNGTEWLFRSPKPAFWRATTCNDRGNGFSRDSAIWMGADMFSHLKSVTAEIDGTALVLKDLTAPQNAALLSSPLRSARSAKVTFTYLTATTPKAEVSVKYTASEDGLLVEYEYKGVEGLPSMPVCAMRFALPFLLSSYDYTGLSGETYPDRLCGGEEGSYHITDLSPAKYVVPQECGMHMKTRTLVMNHGKAQLKVKAADESFSFSLLPYTPLELESAFHHEELPAKRRTYLTIAARVRGVGGINSWGARPEEKYEIPADGSYSFRVVIS